MCESIVKKIHDSLGKGKNIKFYFSAPSFSQEKSSDEAKKTSQNYRDRIRRILGKLNKQKALQGIEFPQNEATGKEKGFLYEQLGVFYYYTYCESQVDLTLPNATYLILDVGGSTTDIAIIQTRGEGKLADAYPIHESFSWGGSNFDHAILYELLQGEKPLNEDEEAEALERVEKHKIEAVKYPKNNFSLTI